MRKIVIGCKNGMMFVERKDMGVELTLVDYDAVYSVDPEQVEKYHGEPAFVEVYNENEIIEETTNE